MYGFYISYDNKNYKLLENMDEHVLLDDAIKCLENNDIKIDKYIIKNGQYGYYILYNKKFYSIPKDYDIQKLTKDACDIIVKLPKKVKL